MVLCTGSIAYDYILTFKGRFKEHILLDKTHILNLSFLVDDLQKRRGGVAGNYAYNLALLGYPSAVLATAGTDAAEYRDWLAAQGVDCRGLRLLEGELSATGFTTTDMDDNQGHHRTKRSRRDEEAGRRVSGAWRAVCLRPCSPAADDEGRGCDGQR